MTTTGASATWAEVHVDPVWGVEVRLSPLERDLLATPWLRRLAGVAHAGAAAVVTPQTYSRLTHSLGLLALVAHVAPDDALARTAALLHDVGHTPLSHTVEGVAGLDHHRLTDDRVADLAPVLARHGVAARDVAAVVRGERASVLAGGAPGLLRLDHLESFVRSTHAHGRAAVPAAATLAAVRVEGGAVTCDAATAADVARMVVEEAERQTSARNVTAVALVRDVVRRALATTGGPTRARLAGMTDDELWSTLLALPATRARTREVLAGAPGWRAVPVSAAEPADGGLLHVVERLYLDLPVVDGTRWDLTDALRRRVERLPRRYVVRREPARR